LHGLAIVPHPAASLPVGDTKMPNWLPTMHGSVVFDGTSVFGSQVVPQR
jgi:hypothetical protein